MSAGISSCCTPCAGAPVVPQQQVVTSGGDIASEVPNPEIADGGGTGYEATPAPEQDGSWVPAPTLDGDVPPDPIAGPDESEITSASQLATWPEWQSHLTRLGLSSSDVTKIGAANLSNEQLAEVYEQIRTDIIDSGSVPGTTQLPGATTSSWSPAWEQRFTALGLPADFIAALKAEAAKTGADDAKLQSVYDQTVAKIRGQQPTDAPSQSTPATPVQPTQQQPSTSQPGWNAQIEQAFRALGMPDEIVKIYAESGAPLSGLEAAHKHASARVEDFTKRGWAAKFQEAGIAPMDTWSQILGAAPATDEDLQQLLDDHKKGQRTIWQKGGQLATSLFPGGRFLQYVFGREAVSGDKIDRTSPMEIGMAALSVASVFAAIRGGKNIATGWKALDHNLPGLNGVSKTLTKLNLPPGEISAVQDAALGATQTWGTKQKLLSLIPGTQLHKTVVGFGHADAAAMAFNTGGAAKILANDADGALQLATITQMFDDIKSGAIRIQGGANAYLGSFKKGPIMTLGADKQGEIIKVAKNLRIGNGNSQLVGLMEQGGTKLGRNPEWLGLDALGLIDDVAAQSDASTKLLGKVMAGNLAKDLGGFTKDGLRPMSYLKGLASAKQPSWYADIAAATKAKWPTAQMPRELFDVLGSQRLISGLADEAAVALTKLDRSTLTPQVAAALDDAVARLGDTTAALDAAKVAGKLSDEAVATIGSLDDAVSGLVKADPELAKTVFGTFLDETALTAAQRSASTAVRNEWVAAAATKVDDLAAVAGDAAPVASSAVDTAADAARQLADLRAVNAARPVNAPIVLTADAAGHARTPAGLIIPSYASPVTGFNPAGVDKQSIAKLAAALQSMRP